MSCCDVGSLERAIESGSHPCHGTAHHRGHVHGANSAHRAKVRLCHIGAREPTSALNPGQKHTV